MNKKRKLYFNETANHKDMINGAAFNLSCDILYCDTEA